MKPFVLLCVCVQLKPAGTPCRESSNSCDLPEFCTGTNPHCPANVYLHDGHSCHNMDGYCYNGICQTHEQQCITLWGPGWYHCKFKMWIAAGFLDLFCWLKIWLWCTADIHVSLIIHFWHCNSICNHCLARTSRSVLLAFIQWAQAVWKLTLIAVIYSICLFILLSKRIQAWHILSFHLFLVYIQAQTRWKNCTVSYFHLWQWAYAVLFSFSLFSRSETCPGDLFWKGKLCRWSLWKLWKRL